MNNPIINNREIATAIWLLLLLASGILNGSVRKSFIGVLKAFFMKKIIISIVTMAVYILSMTKLLFILGLWDISQIKNTLVWSVFVAVPMLFKTDEISREERYFRKTALNCLKLIIILQFILNLHVLPLLFELILVPVLSILAMVQVMAESDLKYREVRKPIDTVLFFVGFGLMLYAAYSIFFDFGKFLSQKNFTDFITPTMMTITFFPFIYFMALYVRYENLFVRLPFFIENGSIRKFARTKILLAFNFNLNALNEWSKQLGSYQLNTKENVSVSISNFKRNTH